MAANVLDEATGEVSSLAPAYAMVEVDGVSVAIIGLSAVDSKVSGLAQAMQGLVFAQYNATLEAVVPEARAAGADVVVVVAHACAAALVDAVVTVTAPADAYFALRCGAIRNPDATLGTAPLMFIESDWKSYARLGLTVSATDGSVTAHDARYVDVTYPATGPNPVTPSPEVQSVVDTWKSSIEAIIAEVIGYTATGVVRPSWELHNFFVDSWLATFPDADFALQNIGGIQAGIAAGDITVGSVIDVGPFDNVIFKLTLTGEQLADVLFAASVGCSGALGCPAAVGGFTYLNDGSAVTLYHTDGTAVEPTASFTVLVNNFMYFGGAGFAFQAQDPTPVDTGVNYRQPAVDALKALNTSSADPLENHLDSAPRNMGP